MVQNMAAGLRAGQALGHLEYKNQRNAVPRERHARCGRAGIIPEIQEQV